MTRAARPETSARIVGRGGRSHTYDRVRDLNRTRGATDGRSSRCTVHPGSFLPVVTDPVFLRQMRRPPAAQRRAAKRPASFGSRSGVAMPTHLRSVIRVCTFKDTPGAGAVGWASIGRVTG